MDTKQKQIAAIAVIFVVFIVAFFAVRYFIQSGAIVPSSSTPKAPDATTAAADQNTIKEPVPPFEFWQVEGKESDASAAERKDIEELKPKLTDQITFVTKNIIDDPKLGEYFDIKTVPTLMVFDSENKLVFRFDGYLNKDQLTELFKQMGVLKP